MTRSERRLLVDTALLGTLLTLVLMAAEWAGLLAAPEQFFYDLRARYCQYFTPPPTDKLVHIDIDDRSLEVMGRWPWPRDKMAEIVDEIGIAGARAMAMDIIYSEPEPPTFQGQYALQAAADGTLRRPSMATTVPSTRPAAPGDGAGELYAAVRLDHDAALAAALKRFGHAIVPVSLNLTAAQTMSPAYNAVVSEWVSAMELTDEELIARLAAKNVGQAAVQQVLSGERDDAHREAMFQRIAAEMRDGETPVAELRRRILPRTPENVVGSTLLRSLESEYERYVAVRALRRFARPMDAAMPQLMSTRYEQATVSTFTAAGSLTGFVDYVPLGDGIVRNVPLLANHRDFAFPQMGLALACAMLGVNPRDLRISADRIVIPCPDGREIAVPVRTQKTPRGECGMFFDIPWFGRPGPGGWETMYDYPAHRAARQHLPIHFLWEACETRHRIARNNEAIDDAVAFVLTRTDGDAAAAKYMAGRPAAEDTDWRRERAARVLKDGQELLDFLGSADRSDWAGDQLVLFDKLRASVPQLKMLLDENVGLEKNLVQRRAEIHEQLNGRAVLIGYIAVGAIADFIPTSLHPRCPGVVVHGVIFNSIMTGQFWRTAPRWVTILLVLGMGAITTMIVARLSAWKALVAAGLLAVGYLVFNGLYLFDKHNLVVGMAGPLAAIGVVWSGGTLARYILEASERARAEKYFRNYVDPALVDYVLGDDAQLDGQRKEMTVVFTDLEGFTTLSEQLGERSIPLLNRYMGLMVPIIRKNRGVVAGYLNKLLGDGMMFFFGAPFENPHHAPDAVHCAMEMQATMVGFNESIAAEGLPRLKMRIGICAGHMIVGNCGPTDRTFSDYTVLGDNVNLASRLEGANKAFGSGILLNGRARELTGDRFLFRPIGRLQVKGKREGIMTYEALALGNEATADQKKLAEMTTAIVTNFMAGRFGECLEAIKQMEELAGQDKLLKLYRGLCDEYLRQPPAAGFDGQIVLTEK